MNEQNKILTIVSTIFQGCEYLAGTTCKQALGEHFNDKTEIKSLGENTQVVMAAEQLIT